MALPLVLAPLVNARTGFSIAGETEGMEFTTGGSPTSSWPVTRALLYRSEFGEPERFSGSISFADSVHVRVERVALGSVRVRAEAARTGAPVGTLRNEADQVVATLLAPVWVEVDSIEARARAGETVVVPFTGRAELGGGPGHETGPRVPLLRSGAVRMIGVSLVVRRGFEAGAMPLEPGDQVRVPAPDAISSGYVVADDRPALNAVIRVRARTLHVERLGGSQGYSMSVSLFDVLRNDPVVSSLWTLLVFWFGILTFLNRPKPEAR
ncbi:MAG TPA: hypothetical protein VFY65_16790 [Longimicrobium sp.]|nr:hypothetical protein [Longimicrobium sp.]